MLHIESIEQKWGPTVNDATGIDAADQIDGTGQIDASGIEATSQIDGTGQIDATGQIEQVTRALGTRMLEAGAARVLTISQTYRSSVQDVWDACTSPERIQRWFLPISGELRLGGRYQLEG